MVEARQNKLLSTFDKYKKHSNDLVNWFVAKGYKENLIWNQIEKVDSLERSTLLNKTDAVQKNVIPFSLTYIPALGVPLLFRSLHEIFVTGS